MPFPRVVRLSEGARLVYAKDSDRGCHGRGLESSPRYKRRYYFCGVAFRHFVEVASNPSNRYDVFVRSICKIVDDAACPSPDPRELTDAQLNDSLKMFETWFDRKKPDLKKQAEAERPYLASLAKELNIDIE